LWNESFFSAPQLKRGPLDSPMSSRCFLAWLVLSISSCSGPSGQPAALSPTALAGCYQFEFASWRSGRPGFRLDTLPRVFRLTTKQLGPAPYSGLPRFRAYLVSGPTFGDYAPPVQPTWNRITSDSGGFSLDINDPFFGVSLSASGAGPTFKGSALIRSDELFQDSTGAFSVIVAETSVAASRVKCP